MSTLSGRLFTPAALRGRLGRLRRRRDASLATLAARSDVVIRRALESDGPTLDRLAALDEAPPLPPGERLLAEVDGRVVAALDERSGRVVSDPYTPAAAARDLLVLRARQLGGAPWLR